MYKRQDIDVISIRSGPIQTEIWRKNIDETTPYEGTPYEAASKRTQRIMHHAKKNALPPSVISELVLGIIEGRKKSSAIMSVMDHASRKFYPQALLQNVK